MGNIILVGYMGCGKSTVGKNLAKITGYDFIDTDEIIEKNQGKTISEIFAESGEEAFRQMETELLKAFLDDKKDEHMIPEVEGITPFSFHKWAGTNAQYPNFYKPTIKDRIKNVLRKFR